MKYATILFALISTVAFGASNKITNSQVATNAAIAHSKMAAMTVGRAMATDSSGFASASSVTSTELGYLSGVSSGLQAQLDAKQALDADLTAIAALSGTNTIYYRSGANTWSAVTIGSNCTFTGGVFDCSGGGGGGGTWGSITGTLSDQTDLNTALGLKAPLASPSFTGTVTLPTGLTGLLKATSGVVSTATSGTDYEAALPSQTGNSGKVLGTNGTTKSWVGASGRAFTPTTSANWLSVPANDQEAFDNLAAQRPLLNTGGEWVGSIRWAATANCQWLRGNTSIGSFSADTECPTPTVAGALTAPGTKIPAFTITASANSRYVYVATGVFGSNTAGYNTAFAFSDGTSSSGAVGVIDGTFLGEVQGSLTSSAAGSTTVNMQGRVTNASASASIDARDFGLEINVYRMPQSGNVTSDLFRVGDFGGSTWTPTVSAVTASNKECSYSRFNQFFLGTCKFSIASGTGSEFRLDLPSGITTASTIASKKALVSNIAIDTGATAAFSVLAEASQGYVTIGQQNGSNAGLTSMTGSAVTGTGATKISINFIVEAADAGGNWTTFPIGAAVGIKSDSSLAERVVRGNLSGATKHSTNCSSSTCNVFDSTTSGVTVSSGTSGKMTLSFPAGTFSATPFCSFTGLDVPNGRTTFCGLDGSTGAPSATTVYIQCREPAGTVVQSSVDFRCEGPR